MLWSRSRNVILISSNVRTRTKTRFCLSTILTRKEKNAFPSTTDVMEGDLFENRTLLKRSKIIFTAKSILGSPSWNSYFLANIGFGPEPHATQNKKESLWKSFFLWDIFCTTEPMILQSTYLWLIYKYCKNSFLIFILDMIVKMVVMKMIVTSATSKWTKSLCKLFK